MLGESPSRLEKDDQGWVEPLAGMSALAELAIKANDGTLSEQEKRDLEAVKQTLGKPVSELSKTSD